MYGNEDVAYARGRLAHTVITHQGVAVMVEDVAAGRGKKPPSIFATEIKSGKRISDVIDNYDLTPVKLGFVNQQMGVYGAPLVEHSVQYIVRNPMRNDWRQGLRKENVSYELGDKWWDVSAIADTIENTFPSIEDARNKFKERTGLIAWSRDFAMNNKEEIFYRAFGKIGNFIDNTRNYLLDAKFFWVEERLREAVK